MAENPTKHTSKVWDFFELNNILENGKKIRKTSCKLCDGLLLAYSGGTSNLHNHLKAKHSSHIEKDEDK